MIERTEDRFRGAGSIEIFYRHWRSTEIEPRGVVVLVHGFGEHGDRYSTLIEHLAPAGYRIYAADHRGHGRSPGRRGHVDSWDEFRLDIGTMANLARKSAPGLPLILYGHSLGGLMVLDYALHAPDSLAGVVASGPILTRPDVPSALLLLGRLLSRTWPAFSLEARLDNAGLSRDPEVLADATADPLLHGRASARFSTEFTATVQQVMRNALQWSLPLLILHGEMDRVAPAQASRAFFERVPVADKTYLAVPGGYHEPHNDVDREQTMNRVVRWLDQHAAPR